MHIKTSPFFRLRVGLLALDNGEEETRNERIRLMSMSPGVVLARVKGRGEMAGQSGNQFGVSRRAKRTNTWQTRT